MMQSDLKVSSKPPLAATNVLLKKRHSLHAVEPLKRLDHLVRRGSHELIRKEESGSWGNLRLLDSKERSASLAQLKTSGRTLSASNLAALSDSNLSIQVALPQRSYEHTGSKSNLAKQGFEVVVKRYYEQLTVGCGNAKCWNKFCASNGTVAKLNSRLASFVSIELATLGKVYFCKESMQNVRTPLNALSLTNEPKPVSLPNEQNLASLDNEHEPVLLSNEQKPCLLINEHKRDLVTNERKPVLLANDPESVSLTCEQKPVSFLHKFFSSSPFTFLFSNESTLKASKKQRSGSLSDVRRTLTISGSESSLKLNTTKNDGEKQKSVTQKSHVNTMLDSTKKGLLYDKSPSPTLIDLQNDIESVDVDDAVLEEFEEQCVLEMSSSNLRELSLTHLTLPMLETSVENYRQCGDASFIVNTIRTVFSSPEALNASFNRILTTNELQSSKQNASFVMTSPTSERCELNLSAVREAYMLLLDLEPKETFVQPLQNSAEIHLKTLQTCKVEPSKVLQLVILLENPLVLENNDLLQTFCCVVANLETRTRDSFVEVLVEYDRMSFQRVLKAVQRLLSSRVHTSQCSEPHIIAICMMLATLHEVNFVLKNRVRSLVAISEFYNIELSQKLDYKLEYEKWRIQSEKSQGSSEAVSSMSILDFPFVLEPASKVRIMRIHAMRQMGLEYRDAILYQAKVNQAKKVYEDGEMTVEDSVKSAMSPFLVLEVRRDHLIEDTLVQVKLKENDLKKALKIRYVGGGEEGLDLGGLQKEFFHIIINDIIQPDYGMFTYLEEVERMWINCNSLELESDLLFELVGTLLGVAIYNGIILDLHFPPVIYKKLQGCKTDLADLKDVQPLLARNLQSLLQYDGDIESTFCFTFE
ncbi:ubiquitin- ligase E3A-like, partial [Paramuricea clavata]